VVIAGLENNRLPNVQGSEESQSIIQIIRPAEESDGKLSFELFNCSYASEINIKYYNYFI